MFKDTKQHKEELRKQYRTIRKDIDESYSSYAANSLINLFSQCIKGKTIAAYIPIGNVQKSVSNREIKIE